MCHFWNINISLNMKITYISNLFKDETLHDEGIFLKFLKNGQKKFPTHVEKIKRFKN